MVESTSTAAAILEKKGNLEEELRRVERQIYELEGEYLQARARPAPATVPCYLFIKTPLMGLFSVFSSHAYVSRRPSKTVTFCAVGRDIWANRRVAVRSAESTAFARQIACSLHPPRRARAPKPRAAVRQRQDRQQGERPRLSPPPQPRPLAVPRSKSPLVWSPVNASGEEMLKSSRGLSSRYLDSTA